jgi:hypothetical protein
VFWPKTFFIDQACEKILSSFNFKFILRRKSSFLAIFQDGLRPQGLNFFEFFFLNVFRRVGSSDRQRVLKFFFYKILAVESSKVERDRHFPRWISSIFKLFFQNFFSPTQSFNPSLVTRK